MVLVLIQQGRQSQKGGSFICRQGGSLPDSALVWGKPQCHQEPCQPRMKPARVPACELPGAWVAGLGSGPFLAMTPFDSFCRDTGAKLFLGGLSWDTTEGRYSLCGRSAASTSVEPGFVCAAEKLAQHFGDYGEIVEGK